MAGIVFDDGEPTKIQKKIADFVARAEESVIGHRVTSLSHDLIEQNGKKVSTFTVYLDNGEALIFFAPAAYGIGKQREANEG